jgi:mannose-6-phosphate isomerase-like protein (cupin superfamily)
MKNVITAAALVAAFALGALAVHAQEGSGGSVQDASQAFSQLTTDTGGTVTQPIMRAPAGDVLAVYIVRAPRQVFTKQDELFYVISGHGTANVGYPSYEVKPGSVISIPRNTAFQITATGRSPIKAILIASPNNNPDDKKILEH